MFREKYKHFNAQIRPSDHLVNHILIISRNQKKCRIPFKKIIAVSTVICILLSFSLPELASNIESVYQLMYMVSPDIAQFFMPMQKSDEDNGIRLEVVSAYIHDNIAEVYLTIQDLTDNRVDATTDLYDSYSINQPFNSSSTCKFVGFDTQSQTATFLVTISDWTDRDISGDKITFSLKGFLSNKMYYKDILIPIDLADIPITEKTKTVSLTGSSGIKLSDTTTALIPSDPQSEFPVEGIELTGAGYVDGKLHLQTAVENNLEKDNHGFFYLMDSSGERLEHTYSISFREQTENSDAIDYQEYVFDISPDNIGEYKLYGYFVTSGRWTEGNWRVTFPLINKSSSGIPTIHMRTSQGSYSAYALNEHGTVIYTESGNFENVEDIIENIYSKIYNWDRKQFD